MKGADRCGFSCWFILVLIGLVLYVLIAGFTGLLNLGTDPAPIEEAPAVEPAAAPEPTPTPAPDAAV